MRLDASHWELFRELRLEMLTVAPTVFWSTLDMYDSYTMQQWQDAVAGDRSYFVARESGSAAGILGLDPCGYTEELALDGDTVNIVSVYVRRASRGRGVLEALMKEAAAWMREQGRTRMLLETVDDNRRARAAYERLGFRETGRTFPDPRRNDHVEVEYEVRVNALTL